METYFVSKGFKVKHGEEVARLAKEGKLKRTTTSSDNGILYGKWYHESYEGNWSQSLWKGDDNSITFYP